MDIISDIDFHVGPIITVSDFSDCFLDSRVIQVVKHANDGLSMNGRDDGS